MANLLDNLKLADLVNTASDEILTEELITMQLVNEGTVEPEYPEVHPSGSTHPSCQRVWDDIFGDYKNNRS